MVVAVNPAFGTSAAVREVLRLVDRVAAMPIAVLLLGESGTGKELIARHVHAQSRQSAGPFVALNVAAIPVTLLEAELFGVERGAFTGADERRAGRFELAENGTLFLDEIGEVSLELQAKLLRVLESREYSRVGGNESLTAGARIIAATNRPLEQAVKQGRFREDLYYRLNVFPIQLPALRDRKDDIATIANDFAAREGLQMRGVAFSFDTEALGLLEQHDWPGNVRELKNLVSRAVILSTHPVLTAGEVAELLGQRAVARTAKKALSDEILLPAPHTNAADFSSMPLEELVSRRLSPFVAKFCEGPTGDLHELVIAQVERALFRLVLEQTHGNQGRAADILGINRNTLRTKLRALGVPAK